MSAQAFSVTLAYSDGTSERIGHPRKQTAERFAERYRGKIGRPFRLFNADYTADRFATLVSVELQA